MSPSTYTTWLEVPEVYLFRSFSNDGKRSSQGIAGGFSTEESAVCIVSKIRSGYTGSYLLVYIRLNIAKYSSFLVLKTGYKIHEHKGFLTWRHELKCNTKAHHELLDNYFRNHTIYLLGHPSDWFQANKNLTFLISTRNF